MRVIAIEEHFRTPELLATDSARSLGIPARVTEKLLDVGDGRLADMDAAGIDFQVLAAGGPGFQDEEVAAAIAGARLTNDFLAGTVRAHPDRFAGFATLPTPDPGASAVELERAVTELGFKGAMIYGTTNGRFYDHKDFWPIFEAAERLGVPVYLHPAMPSKAVMDAYYSDFDEVLARRIAGAAFGWHVETGMHALRLVVGGVFDDFPGLQVILGHMGEGIPFFLARAEAKLHQFVGHLQRSVTEYFCENFYVTTSGFMTDPPLLCTLAVMGVDRVIFSVDYPYEDNAEARAFLDAAPVSPEDLEKIAHGNVERLLGL